MKKYQKVIEITENSEEYKNYIQDGIEKGFPLVTDHGAPDEVVIEIAKKCMKEFKGNCNPLMLKNFISGFIAMNHK